MSFLNELFDGNTPTVAMVAAVIAGLEAQLPAARLNAPAFWPRGL